MSVPNDLGVVHPDKAGLSRWHDVMGQHTTDRQLPVTEIRSVKGAPKPRVEILPWPGQLIGSCI